MVGGLLEEAMDKWVSEQWFDCKCPVWLLCRLRRTCAHRSDSQYQVIHYIQCNGQRIKIKFKLKYKHKICEISQSTCYLNELVKYHQVIQSLYVSIIAILNTYLVDILIP